MLTTPARFPGRAIPLALRFEILSRARGPAQSGHSAGTRNGMRIEPGDRMLGVAGRARVAEKGQALASAVYGGVRYLPDRDHPNRGSRESRLASGHSAMAV